MDEYINYGTPNSFLLEKIKERGFKPIGITVMMCEETFIFKSEKEAAEAWRLFAPEGWWYGFDSWEKAHIEYLKDFYPNNEELGPTVYWLDKNYEPKNKEEKFY